MYLPFFAGHSRVDLVMEDGARLHRVQVKTARRIGEVLAFRTCSYTRNVSREYVGEVEYFGVYSPDLDAVYLVPVSDVPARGRICD